MRVVLVLSAMAVAAIAAGCSSTSSPAGAGTSAAPDAQAADAGLDASLADAAIDGATPGSSACVRDPDAAAPSRFVATANDAGTADGGPLLPPQINWNGGADATLPVFVPITFDGDPFQGTADTFAATMGCSSFWRAFASDYGMGDAISATPVHVSDAAPTTIDDSAIKTWLSGKIATDPSFPPPDGNTIYAIIYPAGTTVTYEGGTSCTGFYGYHDVATAKGQPVAYMVAPRCGDDTLLTSVMSHELSEAATDPQLDAYNNVSDQDLAWEILQESEVADFCDPPHDSHFIPTDLPFTVQRIWSNRAAAQGQNPCVPADSAVWFAAVPIVNDSVAVTIFGRRTHGRGLSLPVGSSAVIDVQLIATGATSAWDVDAEDWGGTAIDPQLQFSFDQTSGNAGDVLKLTITRVAANPTFGASPFVLRSSTAGVDHVWAGMVGD